MKEKTKEKKKKLKLSRVISDKLLIAVTVAFFVSYALTFIILYNSASDKAYDLTKQNACDVRVDIYEKTREYFIQVSDFLSDFSSVGLDGFKENLLENKDENTFVTDLDGIIIAAGREEYMGRSVRNIPEISELIDEFNEVEHTEETEDYSWVNMTEVPVLSLNGETELYFGIISVPDFQGLIFFGISTDDFNQIMYVQSQFVAANRHIGQTGFNIITDEAKTVMTSPTSDAGFGSKMPHSELVDEFLADSSDLIVTETFHIVTNSDEDDSEMSFIQGKDEFWGKDYYYTVTTANDCLFVFSMYPEKEALSYVDTMMKFLLIVELVIFTVLFFTVRLVLKRSVIRKINAVNASLTKITDGDLDEKVEVRDTCEFDALSSDINATVDKLKEYIAEAAARIDADLAVAKAIQSSALPNVFPPFPDRKEFELFASMSAAKEVGGDFYDFYMLGNNTLGFLIADVSGKSIPGAMFMMTAKTVIKSLAESGLPPAEVFTKANEKLCEGNDAEMFVTAWLGYLDLKTGLVRIANAGHNPVVLISGGKAEYLFLKPGLMLAGMEGISYREQSVQLKKGDMLYLYTDGVTEAMDKEGKLYGDDRLKELLSFGENYPEPDGTNGLAGAVCAAVAADVASYTAGAEQSDDITMLCIRYLETSEMKELTIEAAPENIDKVIEFVDEQLEGYGCGVNEQAALDVAVDELFTNIASYAYRPEKGYATVRVDVTDDPLTVEITFIDNGKPYDPLANEDPDTTLPVEERPVGGLGILIVKKSMDSVSYEYKDGRNILTIKKKMQ